MPFNPQKRSQTAKGESRGSHGQFVSSKPKANPIPPVQLSPTQTVKVQVETPQKQNDPDSLVSLNIKNPLAVFTRSLTKAINKPMTIKVPPLYAFPIIIATLGVIPLSFFGLGKQVEKEKIAALPTPTPIVIVQPTATPAPILVSRMGTIKATYLAPRSLGEVGSIFPTPPISQITQMVIASDEAKQSISPTEIPPTPTPVPTRFVLEKGETITFLIAPPTVNLSYYLNRKVLISGLYDKTKNTLHINKSGDIEVLP